jgi:hypothetical protein
MVIKPTRAFKSIWDYCILIIVNQLLVSATFCCHLHEEVFTKVILQRQTYHCTNIILRFKYLYIKYFWFYSESEDSVHGHEMFKIYGILKFAVRYFLLDSVLVTESSIPDCWFGSWSNFTNNHKGAPTVSTLLNTCLGQRAQYTL